MPLCSTRSDRDEATRRRLLRSHALHMINIRRRTPGPNQLLAAPQASIPLVRVLADPVAARVESSVDVRADDPYGPQGTFDGHLDLSGPQGFRDRSTGRDGQLRSRRLMTAAHR